MRYQIEFSTQALQLTSIDGEKVIDNYHQQLTSITEELKIEEAKVFIKEVTKSSFLHSSDYSCFFRTTQFIFMPNSVYDEQLKLNYFELNFGPCKTPSIVHSMNNIPFSVTSIYEITPWVTAFCEMNFPGKSILPTHQAYLNYYQADVADEFQGFIFYDTTSFYIQLFQKQKLLYCQEIPILHSDDIIYYTFTALKKLPIDIMSGKIILYPRQKDATDATLHSNFLRISEFKDIEFILSDFNTYQNELLCE